MHWANFIAFPCVPVVLLPVPVSAGALEQPAHVKAITARAASGRSVLDMRPFKAAGCYHHVLGFRYGDDMRRL
jgi:hypothetical protein